MAVFLSHCKQVAADLERCSTERHELCSSVARNAERKISRGVIPVECVTIDQPKKKIL